MLSPSQLGELRPLAGWGRSPVELCRVVEPVDAQQLHATVVASAKSMIARGLGRSYGDSALNAAGLVVEQNRLNKIVAFDESTGLLTCQPGLSLAEIFESLLPRGWYVPVTPGTKFVTVGGAIAADVHGKNHHQVGSFGNFVRSIDLLLADGSTRRCSPTDDAELFWATIGGMGLTGVIVEATVQLVRAPSAFCQVTYRRTRDLEQTLDCFATTDRDYRYSVAWIDCLARGSALGRSVVMLANDALPDQLPAKLRASPHQLPASRSVSVPFDLPGLALNRWSVRAFNALYYRAHRDGQRVVDYNAFFYPLDSIAHWNRLYGRRGFVQFQALFPAEVSRRGLVALLEKIVAAQRASFLAVLKSSGAATPGMLSYLYPGHTLALDFADTGADLRRWLAELEKLLLDYGGRLYLAKDATMSAETFAKMYPRLDEFRAVKQRVDPAGKFQSSQARRLRLIAPS